MADRAFTIDRGGILGALALGVVLALGAGALATVALRADGPGHLGAADWAALRFTLLQAVLSALLSVALAVPLARALARRRFFGRGAVLTLLGAPFILPVIVAVLGLIAVFGRRGVVSQALIWAGLEPISIYGLHGVVLAHVFFNLPLATRLILHGWQAIPAERFRLAAALGFRTRDVARVLELPMLARILPGAVLVVFLLCLTSFTVALALGGGPKATTVELAIYQAVRFDFDLGRAALLALVQVGLGLGAVVLAFRLPLPDGFGAGLDRTVRRWDASSGWLRAQDALAIGLGVLFLALPLAAVVANGAPGLLSLPAPVWHAAARSVAVALACAALMLALAMPIAGLAVARGWRLAEGAGMLPIAISPLVLGTGLFLMVHPLADPARLALGVTALVNAVMSLPFALRALVPAMGTAEAGYGRLADSLGMIGMARVRLLWLPRMRRALGFSTGLAAALSMGDLGVIALFSGAGNETLPLQMYRLMGAYRMGDAAAAGLLLLALALVLFWLFDRGGRVDADA